MRCLRIFLAAALAALLTTAAGAQSSADEVLRKGLPKELAVRDAGARTYRFTVDYETLDAVGSAVKRQRLSGDYTRGLPGHASQWSRVEQTEASGDGVFSAPEKRSFMEGFRYDNRTLAETLTPDFFKGFPPMAVYERNLVWDTGMFEYFGQHFFEHLQLNVPYHVADGDARMPGVGVFTNRDIVLEWTGATQRNGRLCAVIRYQAFGNPLVIDMGGVKLKGRSDYWGEIWVSLADKQIERATLQEMVIGEIQLPGQSSAQPMHVFRHGTFELSSR